MEEFSLIARHFAPLAASFPGSLNLTDDAALVDVPPGMQLVITKDAITAGVHCFGTEPAALIARKLLRVNLSDLAAKGARPLCYFLALILPQDTQEAWVADFAAGLAQDQAEFGIHLAGGDTTATPGPLSLSLTALGTVPAGGMLRRSSARAGDALYASGTLGDAAAGLALLSAGGGERTPEQAHCIARYHLPQPRLALGHRLRGLATACMDISDGLAQDAGHLCAASGVGAVIEAARLPRAGATLAQALTGGDDYELLFTLPLGAPVPEGCTRIGHMTEESGVRVLDAGGAAMALPRAGYRHFSSPFRDPSLRSG